jgi:nucleosome binding factor SPN SPT16 subunit
MTGQFGLKNFDMVLVLKDFTKAPLHINTIPVESLEGLKDWLDSVNLPFTEGPLNLNWGTIMSSSSTEVGLSLPPILIPKARLRRKRKAHSR